MNSKENLYATSKNHAHMNNVLLIKLRHKKEACKVWKQRQAIQEEYKELFNTAGMGQGKPKLTCINLVWDVKGNKTGLCKYISRKREG